MKKETKCWLIVIVLSFALIAGNITIYAEDGRGHLSDVEMAVELEIEEQEEFEETPILSVGEETAHTNDTEQTTESEVEPVLHDFETINQAEELENWKYELNESNRTIHLLSYQSNDPNVIVHGTYHVNGENYSTILNGNPDHMSTPFYYKRFIIQTITIMSGVTSYDCRYLFYDLAEMVSLDLTGLDTSNVEDMSRMFYGCRSLPELDVTGLDTSKVTNMEYMFFRCQSLAEIDV